jgi:hypothetical protein
MSCADASLRGNVGVQAVHTAGSTRTRSCRRTHRGAVPIEDGKNYNDVLPSAIWCSASNQKLRVGLARELVRARMDQLDVSYDYSFSTGGNFMPSATGGNAKLAPWRANAFDLSYEKYFENRAILSAAVFYKKLVSYIYDITQPYDFTALNGAASPFYSCGTPPGLGSCKDVPIGQFTTPQNGAGGRVDGIELAFWCRVNSGRLRASAPAAASRRPRAAS